MPDPDKVFRGISPYFRTTLRQIEERIQSPEEIAYNALGALMRYMKAKGGSAAILVLLKGYEYVEKLSLEPLFSAVIPAGEISDSLQRILYLHSDRIQDKRNIDMVDSVLHELQIEYEYGNICLSDKSSVVRMYLEKIWEVEVRAAVVNQFGRNGLTHLEQIEPLVLRGIASLCQQIVRRPDLQRIRRPRRKDRTKVSIDTNLLEILA